VRPWVQAAADHPAPATRAAPAVWTIADGEGVHEVVAYARRCLVLRQDAVRLTTGDRVLLIWSWPKGARGRVYAFSPSEVQTAWADQLASPSFLARGWYGFTPENSRFDRHLVRWL
jgi:hypothetical protein